MAPIRFGPGPNNSTALATVAQLDGRFSSGRVQAFRLPIQGRIGQGGSFAFGTSCAVVSWNYLQMSSLQLGAVRVPVCPVGPAIVTKQPGRELQASDYLMEDDPANPGGYRITRLSDNTVFNKLKAHVAPYTAAVVTDITGVSAADQAYLVDAFIANSRCSTVGGALATQDPRVAGATTGVETPH